MGEKQEDMMDAETIAAAAQDVREIRVLLEERDLAQARAKEAVTEAHAARKEASKVAPLETELARERKTSAELRDKLAARVDENGHLDKRVRSLESELRNQDELLAAGRAAEEGQARAEGDRAEALDRLSAANGAAQLLREDNKALRAEIERLQKDSDALAHLRDLGVVK